MNKKLFTTESSYIEYLESLVGRPILDIIKSGSFDYTFKIDSFWYKLTFSQVIGTTFSNGECLQIYQGEVIEAMERLYIHQFSRNHTLIERIYDLYKKLDVVFTQFLLIDNSKLLELTKNLSELLEAFDSIERFSHHFFIISKNETKFSIRKIEEYAYGHYQQHLRIMRINGDKEFLVKEIRGESNANSIINFLNFIYYANKVENFADFKSKILKQLALK